MKPSIKWIALTGIASMLTLGIAQTAHAADTSSQDKSFVEDAGKGNYAEVQMAKLALANSTNKDVRAFATKMIHDHTMLENKLKPFGAKMGVAAPTAMAHSEQDEYDRLSGKKGESFDKDYIQTMVDDHHKDLADFTKEYESTDNAALKTTVGEGRMVIKGHTEMIDGIAHKYNLPAPNKP